MLLPHALQKCAVLIMCVLMMLVAIPSRIQVASARQHAIPLKGYFSMVRAKRIHTDVSEVDTTTTTPPSSAARVFTVRDFRIVEKKVHHPQYQPDWCEVDVVSNYTSGEIISRDTLEVIHSAYALRDVHHRATDQQTFLIQLRLPLILPPDQDLLTYIVNACSSRSDSFLPVHAVHFGSGMVQVHATLRQLEGCIASTSPLSILPLLSRVCLYHDWAKVDVDVHQAIHEARTPSSSTTTNTNMGRTFISTGADEEDKSDTTATDLANDERLVPHIAAHIAVPKANCTALTTTTLYSLETEAHYRVVTHGTSPFCTTGVTTQATLELECMSRDTCNPSIAVKALLEAFPTLTRIERQMPITYSNKFSRGILQSGAEFQEPFGEGLGLGGEGLVVGVADSGIDYDHCFFHDTARSIPFNTRDTSHRKIVRYQELQSGNRGDFKPGHGTHVCGSVAGSTMSSSQQYSDFHGVVPKAKISFMDLSIGAGEGLGGVSDLGTMFDRARDDGARIHSNSWGSGYSYTGSSSNIDDYVFKHPDMLILFAAGNSADAHCISAENDLYCDRHTVLSQASAKNILGVGASMGSYQSWKFAKLGNYILNVSTLTNLAGSDSIKAEKGNFGPEDASELSNLPVILASPIEGCNSVLNNGMDLTGKIVLIRRGSCYFTAKIAQAQNQKAAAVVIMNNDNGDPIIMGCTDEVGDCGIHTPNFMISKVAGEALVAYLSSKPELIGTLTSTEKMDPHKGEENLSEFSSHGPTSDLRYKPDVAAIGELVISAMSDAVSTSFNCDVWASQGTSMATPLTAGLSAMLREYFMKGYHVTGAAEPTNSITNPSAMFMKAAIIHAATPLTGVYDRNSRGDWRQLGKTPTFEQGHGIPRLNESFPTRTLSPVELFIATPSTPSSTQHDTASISNNQIVEYCVAYNGHGEQFRATLVWSDPPVSGAAVFQLVNNLDLIVNTPDLGNEYHGNMVPDQRNESVYVQESTAGTGSDFDTVNNVEKVVVGSAVKGLYRVIVRGTHVVTSGLQFALLATGVEVPLSQCQETCSAATCLGGSCVGGACVCKEGWRGPQCNLHSYTLPRVAAAPSPIVVLEPMQWSHFLVPIGTKDLDVEVISTRRDGDIDLFVCGSSYTPSMIDTQTAPQRSSCSYSVVACETCGTSGPPKNTISFPLVNKLGDGTQSLHLSLVAKCCFPAEARINFGSVSGTPTDITGIMTTPGSTAQSPHGYATPLDRTSMTGITLHIAGSGFTSSSTTSTTTNSSGTKSSSLGSSSHMVYLRSNILRHRNVSLPLSKSPSGFICSDIHVFNDSHMTCTSNAFTCNSPNEFYSVAIVEKGDLHTIIAAPHPSAVSVRCLRWQDASSTGNQDTSSPTPSPTPATPKTTSAAKSSIPVVIAGIEATPTLTATKVILPYVVLGGVDNFPLRAVTSGDSIPAGTFLQLKSTATILPSPYNPSPPTSGYFEVTTVQSAWISENTFYFNIPSSAQQLIKKGCPEEQACNWLRYTINVVQINATGDAITVGMLAVFIAPPPVFYGMYVSPNSSTTSPPEWFTSEASHMTTIPSASSSSSQTTSSRTQKAFIPFVDIEAATSQTSPASSTRAVYLSGSFFSDPRESPFVKQSPQLSTALRGAELSYMWVELATNNRLLPSLAFVHESETNDGAKGLLRRVGCSAMKTLSDSVVRCVINLSGLSSEPRILGFASGKVGSLPSTYTLHQSPPLYLTDDAAKAMSISHSIDYIEIIQGASGVVEGVEEGTTLTTGSPLVGTATDVALFGVDMTLRLRGVGLPDTPTEGSDRLEGVLFPVSTSLLDDTRYDYIPLTIVSVREELLVVQPAHTAAIKEGRVYRIGVYLRHITSTATVKYNTSAPFILTEKSSLMKSSIPVYCTFRAGGMKVTGVEFSVSDTAEQSPGGVVAANRPSTPDRKLFMLVKGDNLDIAFASNPSGNGYHSSVLLTPSSTSTALGQDIRTQLPCLVVPTGSSIVPSITPDKLVCVIPAGAHGTYVVSVIYQPTSPTPTPLLLHRADPLRILLPALPVDDLASSAAASLASVRGGPWLVGATSPLSLKMHTGWTASSVRIVLSASPCFTQQVEELALSSTTPTNTTDDITYIQLSMSVQSMVLSPVFLCFSPEESQIGRDMSLVRVYTPVHSVTGPRLLLYPDTASLSPSVEVTASGMFFNGEVQFFISYVDEFDSRLTREHVSETVSYKEGDTVPIGTLYAALVLGNESCASVQLSSSSGNGDVTASTVPGTVHTISIPGVRRPLQSLLIPLDKVLLPSSRLAGSEKVGATLCVAVSADTPSAFVAVHTFARCLDSEEDSHGTSCCNQRGTCSASNSECSCDQWFGGANCQLSCPVGYAGEACSGNGVCSSNGVCSCMHNPPNRDADTRMEWHGSACHVPVRRLTLTSAAFKAPQIFRLRYSDIISDWNGGLIGRLDGSVLSTWLGKLLWDTNPEARPLMHVLVVVPSTADEARLALHIGSNRILTQKAAVWVGSATFSYTDISLTSSVLSDVGLSGSRSILASTIHGYGRWGVLSIDLGEALTTYVNTPGLLDNVPGVKSSDSLMTKIRAVLPVIQSEMFITCSIHSGIGSQSVPIKGAVSIGVHLQSFKDYLKTLDDFAVAQRALSGSSSSTSGTTTSSLTALENMALQTLNKTGYVNTARVIDITVSNEMKAALTSLDTALMCIISVVVAFGMTYAILEYLGLADRTLMARIMCCCCRGREKQAYLERVDY